MSTLAASPIVTAPVPPAAPIVTTPCESSAASSAASMLNPPLELTMPMLRDSVDGCRVMLPAVITSPMATSSAVTVRFSVLPPVTAPEKLAVPVPASMTALLVSETVDRKLAPVAVTSAASETGPSKVALAPLTVTALVTAIVAVLRNRTGSSKLTAAATVRPPDAVPPPEGSSPIRISLKPSAKVASSASSRA